ncbi:MAG: DNA gyrase/topoisomerase IV subunit A [Bacteroidota bacterium]|nr:DNA gyrase/topoisomerase IV subunit A [Bacteroidota bacterium]
MNNNEDVENNPEELKDVIHVSGMYKNWFLDYASYVILERAIPDIADGLKPVQRRILHSLKELDDGRFHKVANVIGHTMKYHPHGDASIGDAMVQIGQKELLFDLQGNWGNISTGDKAAAARYIEVKLSEFSLEIVFNRKITEWTVSYDGRSQEPYTLPIKFPLLLAQGADGIAVGLSTKILPHNFNELIDASIKIIKGIKPKVFPDFPSGGMADFSNYNDGKRGGKVIVRANIKQIENNNLVITEIPFATTTSTIINSIIRANEKGKIKVKKVEDNTSDNVEILITLPTGVSPDKTIDALYRFTDCELSISPIACVIQDNRPVFLGVSEILQESTQNTINVLKRELEVNQNELEYKWHTISLENIFINNRIYHDIEELDIWEEVISTIYSKILPHTKDFIRDVTDEDIVRLTEIKIKKITRFDLNKSKEQILRLEEDIETVKYNLDNLDLYAINYFKKIKKQYGNTRKRKTEIRAFESIDATKVVAINKKLYVDRKEGFIGTSMRKDEYVCDCSDIDDIIVFNKNGNMQVVKIGDKIFVGKEIIYCGVFKKNDDRTVYNMIYKDGKSSNNMIKRFVVKGITRNKLYSLTKSPKGSKILYFTANSNGEAETVTIHLRALQRIKKLRFDVNFAEISIKGRATNGIIISKNPIKRVDLKLKGISTLKACKIWFDDSVNRINIDTRGQLLGEFKADDKILTINQEGELVLKSFDISTHFDDNMLIIEKFNPTKPITIIYFDGLKQRYFIKRFLAGNIKKRMECIPKHNKNYLEIISTDWKPQLELIFVKQKGKARKKEIIDVETFMAIKGIKARGNKLTSKKIKQINLLNPLPFEGSSNKERGEANTSIKDTRKEDTDGQITLEL